MVDSAVAESAEAVTAAGVVDVLEAEAEDVVVDVPADELAGGLVDGLAGEVDDAKDWKISSCCRSVEPAEVVGLVGQAVAEPVEPAAVSTEDEASAVPAEIPIAGLAGLAGRVERVGSWPAGDMPWLEKVLAEAASDAADWSAGAGDVGAGVDAGGRPARRLGHAEQPGPECVVHCHSVGSVCWRRSARETESSSGRDVADRQAGAAEEDIAQAGMVIGVAVA